jgi:glycosyltransferase involved in cell wall biosynthesis
MDISVIICTYNRCESLRQTLETCCTLQIPTGVTWELLVVDNSSTDRTKDVCHEFAGKLPLRYVFEAQQGKSYALNQSVVAANGDLLLFTDDDVDLDKMWIADTWAAACRHPDAGFFGGKVIPRWQSPPPRWLADHSPQLLGGVSVHYDQGPSERYLVSDSEVFMGANFAIRREIFGNGSRFREDLGPNGRDQVRGEESQLLTQLLHDGCKGVYVPEAIVHHRNPRKRMTERYVREWFIGYGMSEVRCGECRLGHSWFGAPRHAWKTVVLNGVKFLATRWTGVSAVWLPAEIKMAIAWGVITEFRRQARAKKQY